nr:MAG TPA: hypothetical protein [Caudoviricetes sp.]
MKSKGSVGTEFLFKITIKGTLRTNKGALGFHNAPIGAHGWCLTAPSMGSIGLNL